MDGLRTGLSCLFIGGVFITIVIGLGGLRIAQEYQRAVVFRLGRYHSVRGRDSTGLFR